MWWNMWWDGAGGVGLIALKLSSTVYVALGIDPSNDQMSTTLGDDDYDKNDGKI